MGLEALKGTMKVVVFTGGVGAEGLMKGGTCRRTNEDEAAPRGNLSAAAQDDDTDETKGDI